MNPLKNKYYLAVWLWALQACTGLLLVIYVIVHTIDNATILLSVKNYEDMLAFWHETLPKWFYITMVIGLVGVFLVHTLNGIRIASKPYKEIDKSAQHLWMLKHPGTYFWYTQVITGSIIAIFGIWHLIVQHGNEATTLAVQSAARVSPVVYFLYLIFMAAIMFHSFNGVRSVFIKLGVMTDKGKEAVLIGLMGLLFILFFFVGAISMAKFLPTPADHTPTAITNQTAEPTRHIENENTLITEDVVAGITHDVIEGESTGNGDGVITPEGDL